MSDSQKPDQTINVSITTKTIAKSVVIIAALFVLYKFLGYISATLQLIAIAAFLAMALNPAVSWFTKHIPGKSRVGATAVSYVIVLSIIFGVLLLVVPPLVQQGYDVANDIPTNVQDFENPNTPMVSFISRHGLTEEYTQLVTAVQNNLQEVGQRLLEALSTVGSALISIITVLILAFMMLVEGPKWIKRFWDVQHKDKVAKRREIAGKMYSMVTGYVNGQLLIATIAGTFAFVALMISKTIFGVDISVVSLALIVGLFGLIPMIGNTLAAVLVVIICLFVSIPMAITMAIFFLVYQQIENATLQPYIQSKYNELTPLTVFVAALIGVGVAGFLGALVAIPIAGCLRILSLELYGNKAKIKKALE